MIMAMVAKTDDVGGDDCDDESDTAFYTNGGGVVTVPKTTKYLAYTSRLVTITIAKETCKSDFFFRQESLSPKNVWLYKIWERSKTGIFFQISLHQKSDKNDHLEAEGCPHHNPQHASRFFTLQCQDANNQKKSNDSSEKNKLKTLHS